MDQTARPPGRPLTRGAVAARTGCNIETVRYYERIGLLPALPRSAGGHRIYGSDHVKRLNFILRSRQLGFTLAQVRALLRLVDSGAYTCDEVKDMAVTHLGEVERKIADLKTMEAVLSDMIAQCDGGAVPACKIIDALFEDAG